MTSSRFSRVAVTLGGVLCAASLSGCAKRSDRLAVNGKVTLDGSLIEQGSVRFSSIGGEKIYATGAMIKDGEYHVPQSKGLPPGTYRVEITSPDAKGPLVTARAAPGEPPGPPTARERIPAEYNMNSKQTVELATGKENRFDFDIMSKRAK
jgi:hypothetical protein